ncbi:small ribosomal subunit Rsm22 family protein [Bradyrhizobium prioriisuperbiae]|uniref:small ribosomal subunit Rsm22 family protein n=1 Tax=Bradyrhizobium prioriisuperbiae TaxID=2854389 RepID=UPI0028EFB568|nr:small ribosomal subunit Rsm22 family protein [Bradyrhizobium prioritasuperba]
MASHLPPGLTASLARLTQGLSRRDLSTRAASISATYRSGGSSAVIRSDGDALAYALARMPATYAAVAACLAALNETRTDFTPASLLDVGAGPGTATWAAAEAFPQLADFTLLDANPALRTLALALVDGDPRLGTLRYDAGDARKALASAGDSDLVIASYVIGELRDNDRSNFADALWAKTRDTLLVVEPGTPAGYGRIIDLRARLIAAGAHLIAPCPHDQACPLTSPDWCHFTQRLARSRDHKQVKGAEVPFEDEKFSYVALARSPPTHRPTARVLAQPMVSKVEVTAKLCSNNGQAALAKTPRRDKAAYALARRLNWGDAIGAGE